MLLPRLALGQRPDACFSQACFFKGTIKAFHFNSETRANDVPKAKVIEKQLLIAILTRRAAGPCRSSGKYCSFLARFPKSWSIAVVLRVNLGIREWIAFI